jgi:hypothetical protein
LVELLRGQDEHPVLCEIGRQAVEIVGRRPGTSASPGDFELALHPCHDLGNSAPLHEASKLVRYLLVVGVKAMKPKTPILAAV